MNCCVKGEPDGSPFFVDFFCSFAKESGRVLCDCVGGALAG